jgi:hypothetical protein
MTCHGWEERLATSVRDGVPDESVFRHLECCAACREFAGQTTAVAADLATWDASLPEGAEAATACSM